MQRFFAFIFSLFSASDSGPCTALRCRKKACRIRCSPPPARQEKTEPLRHNNQRSQRAAPAASPQQAATDRAADIGVRQTGDAAKWQQQQLQHERSQKAQQHRIATKTPKDKCKIKTCNTGIPRPMMIRNGDFLSFAVQPRERFGRKYVYPRNAPLPFREALGAAQAHK
mgnify:FL=1